MTRPHWLDRRIRRFGPLIWRVKWDRTGWWYKTERGNILTPWVWFGRVNRESGWIFYKLILGPLCLTVANAHQGIPGEAA